MIKNNSIEIDQFIKQEKLTLSGLQKSLPSHLFKIKTHKSLLALLMHLCIISVCIYLQFKIPNLSLNLIFKVISVVLLIYIQSLSMTGLFVLVHDSGHNAFFKYKLPNEILGILLSAPLFINFYSWVVGHNHHHKFSNIKEFDTNWSERMLDKSEYKNLGLFQRYIYDLSYKSLWGLVLGNIYAMTRYMLIPWSYKQTLSSTRNIMRVKIMLNNIILLTISLGLIFYLVTNFSIYYLLILYILPYLVSSFFGSLFTYLHHMSSSSAVFNKDNYSPIRGQVVATIDVRFPKYIEFLCHNINMHLIHHIAPNMPWYNITETTNFIKKNYPQIYHEEKFSIKYLLECRDHCLLDFNIESQMYSLEKINN